jgi:hypothetical protein
MIDPLGSDMPQACSRLTGASVHARAHHVLFLDVEIVTRGKIATWHLH